MRDRLEAGERLLGTFLDSGSVVTAEVVAGAGFDWVVIDGEHGALGTAGIVHQLHALSSTAAAPIVRVPSPRSDLIGWVLDAGAGVMVPRAADVGDVRAAVAATRYAEGRGAAGGVRATAYGRDPSYLDEGDERRLLLVQVETLGALDAVDAIAAVDGVDVLFLGPADLARSLGRAGAPADDPEVVDAGRRIAEAARAHGKVPGVFAPDPAQLAPYVELGYTLLASGSDSGLLRAAADERLTALRRLLD